MFDLFKIKVGFPRKIMGIPIGWEDRGQPWGLNEIHTFCKDRVNVGIENGVVFKFCPTCLIKFEEDKK